MSLPNKSNKGYTRILVLGIDSECAPNDRGVPGLLSFYGNNTGNILFSEALFRSLKGARRSSYHFKPEDADWAECIVIAAANWLNPYSDFSDLAGRLEATNKPIILIGIGVQFPVGGEIELQPGTKRLVELSAMTSKSISVRGNRTAEYLASIKIKNVEVTGCPSLLLAGPQLAGAGLASPPTATNTILMGTRHLFQQTNEDQNQIYRLAMRNSIDLVLQSELSDMFFVLDLPRDEVTATKSNTVLAKTYGTNNMSSIRNYLKNYGKIFFSFDDWIKYMSSKEYSIGSRFHGTIATILAGKRGLLLTHDTRTEEMAKVMGIPSIPIPTNEIFDWNSIQEWISSVDYTSTAMNYATYRSKFAKYFVDNNLYFE